MDWTAGYASDIEYTAGFYREQSPTFLNFVSILNGYEPVPLDKPFTYFELGFGRGLTVNLLAAANPQGRFHAADFNPAHVAGARELAAAAGLDNLALYEDSFGELAAGKVALPMFDFITLHGIYTWVTGENQRHIVDFIGRYLKPGGTVFMSYNAMPGWASVLPLQRLLVEFGDAFPNRSDIQIKGAAALVEKMQQAGAAYFTSNTNLAPRLDALKKGSPNYLVHEYMHKHWEPRYHADIARDMAPAKLDYVGSADMIMAYPDLFLGADKMALVKTISDPSMQETMKDYFLNISFRKDVFIRGARRLNKTRQSILLSDTGFALTVDRSQATLTMQLTVGQVNGKPELYHPLLDALALRPHTLAELKARPELAAVSFQELAQAGAMLVASGQAQLFFASSAAQSGDAAKRMNVAIGNASLHGDELQALAAPLLGNGLSVGHIPRLVYQALVRNGGKAERAEVQASIWNLISSQGRRMMRDGVAMEGDEANKAELMRQIQLVFDTDLPVWRALGML